MFGCARDGARQSSAIPPVVTSKDLIPFCIPTNPVANKSLDGEFGDGMKKEYRSTLHDAAALGSVNRDLYIVDQFESGNEAGGPAGCFSSFSKPDFPPGHVGRVWFALKYEEKTEKLVLSLLKARNLRRSIDGDADLDSLKFCWFPAAPLQNDLSRRKRTPTNLKRKLFALTRRTDMEIGSSMDVTTTPIEIPTMWRSLDVNRPKSEPSPRQINSIVKIYLLPDKRVYGQSKCKKRLNDPVFVDRFLFQVSPTRLKSRTLRMVFVEIDQEKRHHVIGHVTYPLCNSRLDGEIVYKDLEKGVPVSSESTEGSDVEIQLSLCYDGDLSRLTVVIFRAKLPRELNSESEINIEVKLTVLGMSGKIKRYKVTQVEKDQKGPDATEGTKTSSSLSFEFPFKKSFSFDLSPENIDNASLTINLMAMTGQGGQIRSSVSFGGHMFVRGKAAEHWEDVQNRPKEFVKEWHCMSFEREY